MSRHAAATACSPWDLTTDGHSPISLRSPEEHHREALNKAYQKALAAVESAQAVVATVASGLYDVETSQTDVSARLCGRSVTRFTGKKRKLSPSVYDYSDSCFGGTPGKADTPTQDLLPACRSELRHHQLQAVRWLASLEAQGAGGVLADELEADRRAEVAGLLTHMATHMAFTSTLTPPTPTHMGTPGHQHNQGGAAAEHVAATAAPSPAVGGGGGGDGGPGSGGGGCGGPQVCVLLAPGCSLGGWAEAISEHVDVCVHVYDGTAGSAAALQAVCAGHDDRGAQPHPQPHPTALGGPAPLSQQPPAPPLSAGRRGTSGAAQPLPLPLSAGLLGSSGSSSAAGVYPPHCHPHPAAAAAAASVAASPLLRHTATGGGVAHAFAPRPLLVVLSPLEQLHRDAALLSQIPQRLLVVDLAPADAGAIPAMRCSGSGGGGCGDDGGSAELQQLGGGFGGGGFGALLGSEPGSGSGPRRRQGGVGGGMDLEGSSQLQLITRMPAASRVLLSGGVPEPSGDGIWLLLQLLAPRVHRPLWEAVCELQQGLVASGPVGAHCKEAVLSEVHGRLWGLLRPLTLHRRARDVDLATMRAATTNLNLYDHFSAARADEGA